MSLRIMWPHTVLMKVYFWSHEDKLNTRPFMQMWIDSIRLLLNIVFNGFCWSHFLLSGSLNAWAWLHPFFISENFQLAPSHRRGNANVMDIWNGGTARWARSPLTDLFPIFVTSFITDAAVGDTHEGDPPSQGHDFSHSVLFSLQEHHGQLANPTQNPFSCFVFCH